LLIVSMRLGRYEFRPKLYITVLTLIFMSLFILLGMWQLSRAQEKEAIIHTWQQRKTQPASELDWNHVQNPGGQRFRHVRIDGRWVPDRQFLLDNQINEGRPGYQVITPLAVSGRKPWLLVDRGWVPLGGSRKRLPDVGLRPAEQAVVGTVYVPFGRGFHLGGMDDGQHGWPRVIQFLDFKNMAQRLGHPVLPLIIRMDAGQPQGYVREWQPVAFTPARHIGYAVQWFAMALILVLIYLFRNLRQADDGGR
jgi:surfeit locus 1 family protein